MALLRWDRCDPHLPWLRCSRHRFAPGEVCARHEHDFAEACWVESGSVAHRGDGTVALLHRGQARFLAPGQGHDLAGGAAGGVLATISVPAPLWRELAQRYRATACWPWRDGGAVDCDEAQLRALDRLLAGVPDCGQERLDAEWFIAGLLRLLRRGASAPGSVPGWLADAERSLDGPPGLAGGLAELVRRSGRSAAHLSRAVRRHYGCTATELVHRRRCEWAARELRLGTRPIVAIALDAGYRHLGHFYRRFHAVFGCPPRAYRCSALEA